MEIFGMSIEEILACLIIAAVILRVVSKQFGWNRWVSIADDIEGGLREAQDMIRGFRADPNMTISDVSTKAAAHIKGLKKDEVDDIITTLVNLTDGRSVLSTNGVEIGFKNGDISVNPTGLIAKKTRKLSKWARKIF